MQFLRVLGIALDTKQTKNKQKTNKKQNIKKI